MQKTNEDLISEKDKTIAKPEETINTNNDLISEKDKTSEITVQIGRSDQKPQGKLKSEVEWKKDL